MKHLNTAKNLFQKFEENDFSELRSFFEFIWFNFTGFAYHKESRKFTEHVLQWAESRKKSNPEFYKLALLTNANITFLNDDYQAARAHLNIANKLSKGDETYAAACDVVRGFLHRTAGEVDQALKYGLSSIEVLENSKEYTLFLLIAYYWLGGIYEENGKLKEAEILFRKGLDTKYANGLKFMGARLTNGIAGIYMKQKNYPLALKFYKKALALKKDSTEKSFEARGLTDLGNYYAVTGDYEKAIAYNQKALDIRLAMNVVNGSITNYLNLGDIYLKQTKVKDAIDVLNHALQLSRDIKIKSKEYIVHKKLSEAYQNLGNLTAALEHYKLFHDVSEEVNTDHMENKIKNQVLLFRAEQTKKENTIIKAQKKEIEVEKRRSDDLLRNILPDEVAEELKQKGSAHARQYTEVSVLFTDFVNFTGISEQMSPTELVAEIHKYFSAFDSIIGKYDLEKIKTIGDAYMAAGGIPNPSKDHAEKTVSAALEIRDYTLHNPGKFQIRIGINTGPIVAGIVGIKKYAYDIWGDTVNTASRMESNGEPGKVNISESTYQLVKQQFATEKRGKIKVKGKGEVEMYFVEKRN